VLVTSGKRVTLRRAPILALAWLFLLFLFSLGGSGASAGNTLQSASEGHLAYFPLIATTFPPQWIGPDGGLIASVAIYPPNPSIVYAGSWGGGVYLSTNGGTTWNWKSHGLQNLTVVSLAVDPTNPSVAYAGTYKGKLYKTLNMGDSWFFSSQGIQDEAIVYSIGIDPQNPQRVFIATRGISNNNDRPWNGVIYRSDNAGGNWVPKLYNLGGIDYQDWAYALTIDLNSPNILFAATHEHGVYRSINRGDSWQAANNGISNYSTRAVVVGPTAEYANYVYTGVWTKSGVFRSTDLGASWSLKSNGISGAHIYSMDIDPLLPRTLYAATYNMGVMKSTDVANTWSSSGLAQNEIATVRINPLDSRVVFAGTTMDGLYASSDRGNNWVHSQTGLHASNATSLVVSPDDPKTYYVSTDGAGVKRSQNQGASWDDFSQNLGSREIHALVKQPGSKKLFALTDGAGLYRCDLQNISGCWQRVGSNLPTALAEQFPRETTHPFDIRNTFLDAFGGDRTGGEISEAVPRYSGLLALTFAPSNPNVAYLGTAGSGIYKTIDGGTTWIAAGLSSRIVWSIAVDPTNSEVLYAATDQVGAVKKSVNGGGSWTDLSLSGVTFYSLAISPSAPGALYAGAKDGVYLYAGGGWLPLGLAGKEITWLIFHPGNPNKLLAGTTNGAFISIDLGSSWSPGPPELALHTIQSISVDPYVSRLVYFCTTTHGVLKAVIGG
jgi:photosystem II stability/assembly factor-like uncharacterized protein